MGHTTQPGSMAPNETRWQIVGLVCAGFKLPLLPASVGVYATNSAQAQWKAKEERYLGPV